MDPGTLFRIFCWGVILSLVWETLKILFPTKRNLQRVLECVHYDHWELARDVQNEFERRYSVSLSEPAFIRSLHVLEDKGLIKIQPVVYAEGRSPRSD